jgi:sialate O-acetylesterase
MRDIVYSGPLYKQYKIEEDKIRIFFNHADTGLICRDAELTEFAIAGKDRNFLQAEAHIEDSTVVVYNENVQCPIAVRFGWANTSVPNLFNKQNLPACPFRTDDWK